MRLDASWLACALLVGGCTAAIPSGIFACESADGCPDGFECRVDSAQSSDGATFCFASDLDGGGTTGGDTGSTATSGGSGSTSGGMDAAAGSTAADGGGADAKVDLPDATGTCPGMTHTCVGPVPSLWEGPVVTASGATVPGCGGAWPDFDFEASADLQAAPAVCGCTCGAPSGTQCDSSVTLIYYTASNCEFGSVGGSQSFTLNSCQSASPPQSLQRVAISHRQQAGVGSCTPSPSESLPAPTWGTDMISCRGANLSAGTCEGADLCAPAPPDGFGSVCIWREGDHACPADYPSKSAFYRDFTEGRSCSPCGCQSPTGVSCTASATLHGSSCSSSGTIVVPGECKAVTSIMNLTPSGGTPSGGSCAKTGGAPQGAASPADPITVCCL